MAARNLLIGLSLAASSLGGCAMVPQQAATTAAAIYPNRTATQTMLNDLPPPSASVAVAVYNFTDQTGQFKPSDVGQTLSRAVSQGGGSMLIKSLQDAGRAAQDAYEHQYVSTPLDQRPPAPARWFTVVEREQFKDLLNERQVITEMRQRYLGEKGVNPSALPALLFAGVLLEGGVIGYDTNSHTGGIGAGLLGIALDAKWRQDTVTVYLRAVSVKTGEVLASVTTSKTITSTQVDADVFKYVATDKIFQSDNGFTTNEPGQLALQQAIDKAVYGLVMEGADQKLWRFADYTSGWPLLWRYRQERDGLISATRVARDEARERTAAPRVRKDVPPPAPVLPAPDRSSQGALAPRLQPNSASPLASGSQPSPPAPAQRGGAS